MPPQHVVRGFHRRGKARPPILTPRRPRGTIRCYGLSNEDIARQFGISLPMVKEHVNATFAKLGAANRAEAVGIALRKHLLKL